MTAARRESGEQMLPGAAGYDGLNSRPGHAILARKRTLANPARRVASTDIKNLLGREGAVPVCFAAADTLRVQPESSSIASRNAIRLRARSVTVTPSGSFRVKALPVPVAARRGFGMRIASVPLAESQQPKPGSVAAIFRRSHVLQILKTVIRLIPVDVIDGQTLRARANERDHHKRVNQEVSSALLGLQEYLRVAARIRRGMHGFLWGGAASREVDSAHFPGARYFVASFEVGDREPFLDRILGGIVRVSHAGLSFIELRVIRAGRALKSPRWPVRNYTTPIDFRTSSFSIFRPFSDFSGQRRAA